jgi:hypothetical protein
MRAALLLLAACGSHFDGPGDASPKIPLITSLAFLTADNPGLSADTTASIRGTAITATFPFVDVTALVPTFTTNGASVMVDGTPQISGVTFNDFTHGLVYTVVAPDGAVEDFAVSVAVNSLAAPVDFFVPDGVWVAIGDFNGDGKPDLAVSDAHQPMGSVAVLLNTTAAGATTPSFGPTFDFATSSAPFAGQPGAVAVADFNGDGRPDLAVTDELGVSILLNTTPAGATTPSFATPIDVTTSTDGGSPVALAIGDLDGDGRPDLAVVQSEIFVVLNTTPAGAAVPSFSTPSQFSTSAAGDGDFPTSVAIADLNGDGLADLVAPNFADHTVAVLLNTTPPRATVPTFAFNVNFVTSQEFGNGGFNSVATGDFNGDGIPDIVVGNQGTGGISVLLNETSPGDPVPTFAPSASFALDPPSALAIGDVNGDGRPDIVAAIPGGLMILLDRTPQSETLASFSTVTIDVLRPSSPSSVAVADVNGDGKLDVITNLVSVLLAK